MFVLYISLINNCQQQNYTKPQQVFHEVIGSNKFDSRYLQYISHMFENPMVATVGDRSGKFQSFSQSGNFVESQGIM